MDELLTPQQVADRYGITPETLANWRRVNRGPRWVRLGDTKRVAYRVEDVRAWEADRVAPPR